MRTNNNNNNKKLDRMLRWALEQHDKCEAFVQSG